jgi:hypothetical protein
MAQAGISDINKVFANTPYLWDCGTYIMTLPLYQKNRIFKRIKPDLQLVLNDNKKMKKQLLFITAIGLISTSVLAQSDKVGIGTTTPHHRLDLSPTAGSSITDSVGKKLAVYDNTAGTDFYGLGINGGLLQFHAGSTPTEAPGMVLTNAGNVGIGNTAPSARLEVSSGVAGTSGLKFTNINSASTETPSAASLGIDASGNVVVQNKVPVTTVFKSFDINASTPTNSLSTIGSLQFRVTLDASNNASVQARSTTGASNIGILHSIYKTDQNASDFINTVPATLTTTFATISGLPTLSNNADGHVQFNFFSYTDRTFYRVNVHEADGDNLGFGSLGYIFVELQK